MPPFDWQDSYNKLLLQTWFMVDDQLIFNSVSPIALDLKCLPVAFDALQVGEPEVKRWLIDDLKLLTSGLIVGLKDKSKAVS